jgi:hypothetical protein
MSGRQHQGTGGVVENQLLTASDRSSYTEMGLNLNGSDNGVQHSELMGFRTLSIVRNTK